MLKKREPKRKEEEEQHYEPRVGIRFEYGSLLNKAIATLIDAVQLSRAEMKKDLSRLYGDDIAALALYTDNPLLSWRIGQLVARDIILSRHSGAERIEYSALTKAFVALTIAGHSRKPGLKIPLVSGSDVETLGDSV